MTDFSQGQVMLTLALLASRSIWDPKKKNHKGKAKAIQHTREVWTNITRRWHKRLMGVSGL